MESKTYSEIIELLSGYCADKNFLKKQNELAERIYGSLIYSYTEKHNEIKMVENMCTSVQGKVYDKMHIYSEKIHGSTSQVSFSMRGNPTRRELADMVLLSLITKEQDLQYAKIAFVQNKKENEKNNSWQIDEGQLFLLQYFPTFTGVSGIFNNKPFKGQEIAFPNTTGSLGNYGLFKSRGEIIVTIASEISAKMIGHTIRYSSLVEDSSKYNTKLLTMPSLEIGDTITIVHNQGNISLKYPCLQNTSLSMNVYDFVRNFTQFNIGEPIMPLCTSQDNDLFKYVNVLIQGTTLKDKLKIKNSIDEQIYMDNYENLNILCVHLEL